MARPYVLAECTWPMVLEHRPTLAVLPWGATEAHNRHLPYATDNFESEYVAIQAARIAWERGAPVTVLPTVPFGVNTGQLDIPLTLSVNPSTQLALLEDLASALSGQGITRLVLLNGHGGNDFRQIIRELAPRLPLFIAQVNWYTVADPRAHFVEPGDHAGELETSAMMHIVPGLVRPLPEAGPGRARRFRIRALREGWAWAPRQWTRVTDDTGTGDPAAATPEKGARYLEAVTAAIGEFLADLAFANLEDLYGEPEAEAPPRTLGGR